MEKGVRFADSPPPPAGPSQSQDPPSVPGLMPPTSNNMKKSTSQDSVLAAAVSALHENRSAPRRVSVGSPGLSRSSTPAMFAVGPSDPDRDDADSARATPPLARTRLRAAFKFSRFVAKSQVEERKSARERIKDAEQFIDHGSLEFNSYSRLVWNAVVFLFMFYNGFAVPFGMAFEEPLSGASSLITVLFISDYVGDIVFVIDIFLNARTTFVKGGIVYSDVSAMWRHYRDTWFPIDLAASLPLDFIALAPFNIYLRYLLRIPKLLRLSRFFVFFFLWQTYSGSANLFQMVKLMTGLMLAVHWLACGYTALASFYDFETDYYPDPEFVLEDLSDQYLFVFHWAASAAFLGGEGLNPPERSPERAFSLLVVLISVFAFATVIGNIATLLQNLNAAEEAFQQNLAAINNFMTLHGLPRQMQKRAHKYINFLWSRQRGVDDAYVLQQLPPHMRADISMYMHRELITKVPFFQNAVPGFINSLVQHLTTRIYSPDDFVIRMGDQGKELFVVRQGRLTVLSGKMKVLTRLSDGAFFGEVALIFKVNRTAHVRADTFCDILVLSREDLDAVLEQFPEQRVLLRRVAEGRLHDDGLRDLLRSVPLFKDAPKPFITDLVKHLKPQNYSAGDYLIRAGDWGIDMSFLSSGEVEVLTASGKAVAQLKKGSFFGEVALLFQSKRTASIRALTDCHTFILSKTDLDSCLQAFPDQRVVIEKVAAGRLEDDRKRRLELISQLPLFKATSQPFLKSLVGVFEQRHFEPDEMLMRTGEPGDEILILNQGQAGIATTSDTVTTTLDPGAFLGEIAVLYDRPRTQNVRAVTFCEAFVISKIDLEAVFSNYPDDRALVYKVADEVLRRDKQLIVSILQKVTMFADCDELFLQTITEFLTAVSFEGSDYLIRAGEMGTEMMVLVSGKVEVLSEDGAKLTELGDGSCFGEIALIYETKRTASIRAITTCDVFRLTKEDFDITCTLFPDERVRFSQMAQRRLGRDRSQSRGKLEVKGNTADLDQAEAEETFDEWLESFNAAVDDMPDRAGSSSQIDKLAAAVTQLQSRMSTIREFEKKSRPFTEDDEKKARECFRKFDKDNSGSIDHEELREILQDLTGKRLNDDLFNRYVAKQLADIDKDGSGEIDEEEFVIVYQRFLNR